MEVIHLLICIVAAPLTSILILSLVRLKQADSFTSAIKQIFTFEPEKGLAEQPPLWMGLTTPLFYALIIGSYAWAPYSIDISSKGFKEFISVSTLPLAVLSLTIPIAVLVSRLHSTLQTAIQIQHTKLKNNIDIFHAHRKNLFEYFDRIGTVQYSEKFTAEFKMRPRLHTHAFRGSKPEQGTPKLDITFFKKVESHLLSIRSMCHKQILEDDAVRKLAFLKNASASIWAVSYMFLLPEIYRDLYNRSSVIKEKQDEGTRNAYMIMVGDSTEDYVFAYRYALGFYRNLCEFSSYDSEFLESLALEKDDPDPIGDRKMMEDGMRFKKAEVMSMSEMLKEMERDIIVEPA